MDSIRHDQAAGTGKADTEVISGGSSSVLELSAGRLLRVTDGLDAFYSEDGGSSWEGGPLEDAKGRMEGGIEFGLCRLRSGDVGLLYGRKEEAPSFGPRQGFLLPIVQRRGADLVRRSPARLPGQGRLGLAPTR